MAATYEGKYAKMAEQFRADGCDESMIEKFIRQEMEADKAKSKRGVNELKAWKKWQALSEDTRRKVLSSAFCRTCGLAEFAPNYSVRSDKFLLVVEGVCAKCGGRIVRTIEDL
jgi:hypothetical protein